MDEVRQLTIKAPVNIAVIKYWGKKDEHLILPINDSLSVTLSTDELCATTSIAISRRFNKDRLWLNGNEENIVQNKRLLNCLKQVRDKCTSDWKDVKIHICSENNFPTASGLASSAAGYACLVYTLGSLYGITNKMDLSILARMGSGSACRSVYGGFVQWIEGCDSESSYAYEVASSDFWPEIRIAILVVSDKKKETSSTAGMQTSVATSSLINFRASAIVPERVEKIKEAILKKDFETFGTITMKESNQLHAIAQDTFPPIRYMNDTSWTVVRLVHNYNNYYNKVKVAYTFDAGPNACLYMLDDCFDEMHDIITYFYPSSQSSQNFFRGLKPEKTGIVKKELLEFLSSKQDINVNSLNFVISTKVGNGPTPAEESLLTSDGLPK